MRTLGNRAAAALDLAGTSDAGSPPVEREVLAVAGVDLVIACLQEGYAAPGIGDRD
jgi:hypothetical protein